MIRLVIFDCDGVLVDSEGISSRLVAEALTGLGWKMTADEAHALFLGQALPDMLAIIEARVGPVAPEFVAGLRARIVAAMAEEVRAMPGVFAVLEKINAMGLPWRVASNSSRAEMETKFRVTGLDRLIGERFHSAFDVARAKPAPDVFLAAAAAAGVAPARCVVVEDSLTGMRGAVAAGMRVLAFTPDGDGAAFADLGAKPFRTLAELPDLLVSLS